MNISDPLQTDSFEIESCFIHPHEGKTEKVAIEQMKAFGSTFEELYDDPTTFAHTASVV